MPFLDVSDVLLDPDFVYRQLTCTRQAQTVGGDGLAINQPTISRFSGVVTSAGGKSLDRSAEGAQMHGSITIHTRFRLDDGRAGGDADLVTWKGRQYTVVNVNDYSDWGRGFVDAHCELIPLSGGN